MERIQDHDRGVNVCANSIVTDVRDIYVICFVHSDQKLCLHFEVVDRNK